MAEYLPSKYKALVQTPWTERIHIKLSGSWPLRRQNEKTQENGIKKGPRKTPILLLMFSFVMKNIRGICDKMLPFALSRWWLG
jgi:hypothetical protein